MSRTLKITLTPVYLSDGSLDEKTILETQAIPQVRAFMADLGADDEIVKNAILGVFAANAPKTHMPPAYVVAQAVTALAGNNGELYARFTARVRALMPEVCVTKKGKNAFCRVGTPEEIAAARLLRAAKDEETTDEG